MVTLKEVLSDAQRRRIAIGHFNVSDLVGLKAVTGAAEILNVPVWLAHPKGSATSSVSTKSGEGQVALP